MVTQSHDVMRGEDDQSFRSNSANQRKSALLCNSTPPPPPQKIINKNKNMNDGVGVSVVSGKSQYSVICTSSVTDTERTYRHTKAVPVVTTKNAKTYATTPFACSHSIKVRTKHLSRF